MRRFVLVLAALASAGCASQRVADGPPLQLHRDGFTYNSPAKQPVYDWFSLDPAFEAVLERHPAALEEARKSTPYRTASLVTLAGGSVFALKALLEALDSADEFTPVEDDPFTTDILVSVGFSAGTFLFGSIARRYLQRSVSLFNAGETRASGPEVGAGESVATVLRSLEVSPSYRPGAGGGWSARFRFPVR